MATREKERRWPLLDSSLTDYYTEKKRVKKKDKKFKKAFFAKSEEMGLPRPFLKVKVHFTKREKSVQNGILKSGGKIFENFQILCQGVTVSYECKTGVSVKI